MWETTSEFKERKKLLEKTLEQEIIKAIYDEMVDKGSGTVTIKSYDADTELMKLSLEWDNIQIRNIFSSKELAQEVTLKINRKDGKKIFNKDRTHRFDITVKYISHKLRISEIYLKNGDEKNILSSSNHSKSLLLSSNWITPMESICKSKGANKVSDGVCDVNWKNAKKICSESGGRLPNIDELRKVIINCGGKTKYDNDSESKKYS